MMRYANRGFAAAAVAGLLVATACSDTTGPGMGEASVILAGDGVAANLVGDGVSLSLGDVPESAVESLFLNITRIDLHLVGADDDEVEGEESAGEESVGEEGEGEAGEGEGDEADESGGHSSWISLEVTLTEPIDILALSESGVEIADGVLPAGRYNQARFFFDSSEIVLSEDVTVNGGTVLPAGTYDVTIPSSGQTGLKLHLSNLEIVDGETETVAVEVGKGATIGTLNWNANGFRLSPVLKKK